ncbi:thioredoxin family protein [Haloarchaeobius litoreus]|uniref:Thioredoxin family protein n=1 Tax=Haloarchaeobius litoreus TaxID=755306 RepID=A0ABD6DGK2_9EURY|nr:thioredoxin family protein [Haloarchaeobius litoreus]
MSTRSDAKPVRLADGDELDDLLAEEPVVLLELYTKGCGKCQAMEPVIGTVARVTDAAVAMVNPGDDMTLLDRFEVRSTPTFVLFRDGEQVATLADGFVETERMVRFVESGGESEA